MYAPDYEITVLFPVWIPEYTPSVNFPLVKVYSPADHMNYLSVGVQASTGYLRICANFLDNDTYETTVVGSTDICDGKIHWLAAALKPNKLQGWTDYKITTIDTTIEVPTVITLLSIEPSGALVGGIHTWPSFYDTMPRPIQPQLIRE